MYKDQLKQSSRQDLNLHSKKYESTNIDDNVTQIEYDPDVYATYDSDEQENVPLIKINTYQTKEANNQANAKDHTNKNDPILFLKNIDKDLETLKQQQKTFTNKITNNDLLNDLNSFNTTKDTTLVNYKEVIIFGIIIFIAIPCVIYIYLHVLGHII
jgi:hypothetical protein